MDKRYKLNLLLTLTNEVDEFYGEIIKYVPTLLHERYKTSDINSSDLIISIIKAELPHLKKILYTTFDKNLTEEDVDFLIQLYQANYKIDLNKKLFEEVEKSKDLWFNMLIIQIDDVMDYMENKDFIN